MITELIVAALILFTTVVYAIRYHLLFIGIIALFIKLIWVPEIPGWLFYAVLFIYTFSWLYSSTVVIITKRVIKVIEKAQMESVLEGGHGVSKKDLEYIQNIVKKLNQEDDKRVDNSPSITNQSN